MNDNYRGGLLAVVGAGGLCLVCILATVGLGSVATWVASVFGGLDPLAATGLAILAGAVAYALIRRWRSPTATAEEGADPLRRKS